MSIILLFLLLLQNRDAIELHPRVERFVNRVKREVHTSSLQDLNHFTTTYEAGQSVTIDTPDFTSIDTLLSTTSTDEARPSVREHTTWLARRISTDHYRELARYDTSEHGFLVQRDGDLPSTIDKNTGQLTLISTNNDDLLHSEVIMHAESGLSEGDEIIHDIYRFIRLLPTTLRCTTNVTVHTNESTNIRCSIDYEFLSYDDLDNYRPRINVAFYRQLNNSSYIPVVTDDVNDEKDSSTNPNRTFTWTRSIKYTISSVDTKQTSREYTCVVIPDTLKNADLFHDQRRICRTSIQIQHENSSTVVFTRLNQWDLVDIFILVLIALISVLFLTSLILCSIVRRAKNKRTLQIKPETLEKTTPLPLQTKRPLCNTDLFSNNNEIRAELSLLSSGQFPEPLLKTLPSHRHKPGCPQYVPSPENNLLSTDLFTHTTIDHIKKIILPDIPETADVIDDQTYVHFYLPSKQENIPMQTGIVEKSKSAHS